jgi:outer membrane biosynthesis protein TonB
MPTSLTRVKGIGPATAQQLISVGITSVAALAEATLEQLTTLPGFGPFRAAQVLDNARQLMDGFRAAADTAPDGGQAAATSGKKSKLPEKQAKSQKKPKKKSDKKKKGEKKQAKKRKKSDNSKKEIGKKAKVKKSPSKKKAKKKKK